MELYDVVRLREAIPRERLAAGTVGTVVHIFRGPPTAYEVEFADADGRTIATVTLTADQMDRYNG
ncbi:DUF4926 domain-containing protein [Micromonospora globbae]|uniref:DUF4926 domain-containing protein n=1 Tax=Micromonospora globbae TaxID=1894969 RepID=UPI003434FFEC